MASLSFLSRSTLRTLALLLAVATGSACSSSSDGPKEGSTGPGNGGAAGSGGALQLGAGGDASACTACGASSCPTSSATCAGDPDCLRCVTLTPYPPIECFKSEAFVAVASCLCTSCQANCPGSECPYLPCAACLAKTCDIEYDACARKPSCSACTLPDPPKTCSSEPLAVALYLCSIQTCKDECAAANVGND